jgi:curli biogenesis system outer membrane secretion channel CsgG
MKKKILVALLVATSLFGQTKLIEKRVVATGEGRDIPTARDNALINVISQINGISVDSKKDMTIESNEFSMDSNKNSEYSNVNIDKYKQSLMTRSKGYINSYKELDSYCKGKKCYVKVVTTIKSYEDTARLSSKRKKIAVLPIKDRRTDVRRTLTDSLITHLSQSRKFTIVDRGEQSAYKNEQRLITSGAFDPLEASRFGKAIGADMLIVGEVVELKAKVEKQTSSLTSQTSEMVNIIANVHYKVLNVLTREIKYSNNVKFATSYETTDNRVADVQKAFDMVASKITNQILDNIYPLRVVEISDSGDLILNMGGINIKKGDIYDIYYEGKQIVDKYTKEIIAKDEIYAGKIEITRVLPKVSYAKVIDSNGAITEWMVARKGEKIPTNVGTKESTVDIQQSGGVRLPFD